MLHLLNRAAHMAATVALIALLGGTALVLASALTGHGVLFTGGFSSSDQPLAFDQLVITASRQTDSAKVIPTATARPTPVPTVTSIAPSGQGGGAEGKPAASPTPAPSATPVFSSVEAVPAGLGESAETVGGGTTVDSLQAVETSTKTKGVTTVLWESSFVDFDYSLGATISMTVSWTVDQGAASYESFVLRGYTPTSDSDPAQGTDLGVTYPGSDGPTSADISFAFTGLHLDVERNVEIGDAHFKLFLIVDEDGDGTPETEAGYGANVHVEDPQ